eukprot:scaffold206027_cov15-Prasinocladus_malaysianus.AAC.1
MKLRRGRAGQRPENGERVRVRLRVLIPLVADYGTTTMGLVVYRKTTKLRISTVHVRTLSQV